MKRLLLGFQFSLKATIFLIALTVSSCSSSSKNINDGSGNSKVSFIASGSPGLIRYVTEPTLVICLAGAYAENAEMWRQNIEVAVLKWIEPLRPIANRQLTQTVTVVPQSGSAGCHGIVNISSQNMVANTSMSVNPQVNMAASGYYASANVLLHELGHAFGLFDTYYGGSSGACQEGQPQSVMCNTSFNAPQDDDIRGIRQIYAQLNGGGDTNQVALGNWQEYNNTVTGRYGTNYGNGNPNNSGTGTANQPSSLNQNTRGNGGATDSGTNNTIRNREYEETEEDGGSSSCTCSA